MPVSAIKTVIGKRLQKELQSCWAWWSKQLDTLMGTVPSGFASMNCKI